MTSHVRLAADKTLNEVLDAKGSVVSGLFALTMKYGMAPLCCMFLGWVCLEQNKIIREQNSQMVRASDEYAKRSIEVIAKNTEAITKSVEVQANLVKIIEDRRYKINP